MGWEDFHSHPASLAECGTFSLHVSVWPSEELYDGSLLAALVLSSLVDWGSLPDEVKGLKSDGPLFAVRVCASNFNGEVVTTQT